MTEKIRRISSFPLSLLVPLIALVCCAKVSTESSAEPLVSWRERPSRTQLMSFVDRVTHPDSEDFVPVADRIAVFDNDGTLWAEQPAYFQLLFAIDVAQKRIAADPTLKSESPYREIASGDLGAIAAAGEEALLKLVMFSHAGNSEREFEADVSDWLFAARHPTTQRPYTEMVYQPMLELLDYLREHQFQVWIVSGGGQSFLRVWSEAIYGIPPQQVVGSQISLSYHEGDTPALMRDAKIRHINDKSGKPVGIMHAIGKRPILAVGNSDGDFQMLEWITSAPGARLGVLIHHTDGEREWSYDRDSSIGHLERGLDHAAGAGWVVVDMEKDWARVFPD